MIYSCLIAFISLCLRRMLIISVFTTQLLMHAF